MNILQEEVKNLLEVVALIGSATAFIWTMLDSRLKNIESKLITHEVFDVHTTEENDKFNILFRKHDTLTTTVSEIKSSIARMEGYMERRKEDRNNREGTP